MAELLPILVFSICIAYVIEIRDRQLAVTRSKDHERFFTFCLIIVLAVFCGLRTWYNDTVTYQQIYDQTTLIDDFWNSPDAVLASGYGFGLLNSLMKTFGFSMQDYFMTYAFLTIIPYVLFIRKYCPKFIFGVFLMFATGFYIFTFAAIKQCMATGLCLLAVMAATDKKWIRYGLLVFLGFLFHPYSIVYLFVPLMMYKPWTKWTYIYMVLFVAIGFLLEYFLDTIIDVTDLIGANYNEDSFVGEGVNMFRVIVSFVPIVISFIYKPMLFNDSTKSENLMFNLAMLNALIMFVGIFGTANYFARLANYFLPAQVVVLPWILNKIYYKHRPFFKSACAMGYTGYFLYENVLLHNFDDGYNRIGLFEYISSHFN